MKIYPLLVAAGGLGLAVASTVAARPEADSAQSSRRQCFLPAQVNGFTALDRDTVHVKVSASQVYELELFGDCADIDWEQRIGIRSTGGSNWVCQGLDAELIVDSPIGPQRCPVSTIRRLSDEEVQAFRESRRRN